MDATDSAMSDASYSLDFQHTSPIGKTDSEAQNNMLPRIAINGVRRFDRLM